MVNEDFFPEFEKLCNALEKAIDIFENVDGLLDVVDQNKILNLALYSGKNGLGRLSQILLIMYNKFKDERVASFYSKNLLELSKLNDELEIEKTKKYISNLHKDFPGDALILESYYKILINQDILKNINIEEVDFTFLDEMSKSSNFDVFEYYSERLFDLSNNDNYRESCLKLFEMLFIRYPKNTVVSKFYSKTLVNTTNSERDIEVRRDYVKKLDEIVNIFGDDVEFYELYAKGLFNLYNFEHILDKPASLETIKKVKNIVFEKDTTELKALWLRFLVVKIDEENEILKIKELILEWNEVIKTSTKDFANHKLLLFKDNREKRVFEKVLSNADDISQIETFLIVWEDEFVHTQYPKLLSLVKDDSNSDRILSNIFKILNIIEKIKSVLTIDFENEEYLKKLGHYTSLEVLQNVLKPEGRLRAYNSKYMNDTQEGKILTRFLNIEILSTETYTYSPWFLTSLTINSDNLPMWSQYGKGAKGCYIEYSTKIFKDKSSKKDISQSNGIDFDKLENPLQDYRDNFSMNLFKVCYINLKTMKVVGGELFSDTEIDELSSLLDSLKEFYGEIKSRLISNELLNEIISIYFNEICYLFKSADYQYESELRLLQYADLNNKSNEDIIQIDYGTFPKLYLEYSEAWQIERIIFGAKVEHISDYVPYVKYFDKDIKIEKSTIHFR